MSRRAAIARLCVGAAALAGSSCARFGYESLPQGPFDPIPDDTDATHGNGLGGSGGANDAGAAAGAAGGGGAAPSSDSGAGGSNTDAAAGSGGIDAGATNGGTGGAGQTPGCEPAVPTATWAFASDTQGWQLELDPGATGNLSWTSVAGDPAPGALELEATVANGQSNAYLQIDLSPSDFSGKVVYARVFLDAGTGVSAKVFVQTGASAWGDGDEVYLAAQEWHCVSFDLEDPAIVTPGFDRTAVRRVGVFFFGEGSPRLYVDQVTY